MTMRVLPDEVKVYESGLSDQRRRDLQQVCVSKKKQKKKQQKYTFVMISLYSLSIRPLTLALPLLNS